MGGWPCNGLPSATPPGNGEMKYAAVGDATQSAVCGGGTRSQWKGEGAATLIMHSAAH